MAPWECWQECLASAKPKPPGETDPKHKSHRATAAAEGAASISPYFLWPGSTCLNILETSTQKFLLVLLGMIHSQVNKRHNHFLVGSLPSC